MPKNLNKMVNKAPPPPFKLEYPNAELEQPLPMYVLRFNFNFYTFEKTLIVMNKTSFPIIGLEFLRKYAAILDTAQGTINFPKTRITMALTDEMQRCNPQANHDRDGIKTYDTCTRYPYRLRLHTSEYRTSNNWNNTTPTTI